MQADVLDLRPGGSAEEQHPLQGSQHRGGGSQGQVLQGPCALDDVEPCEVIARIEVRTQGRAKTRGAILGSRTHARRAQALVTEFVVCLGSGGLMSLQLMPNRLAPAAAAGTDQVRAALGSPGAACHLRAVAVDGQRTTTRSRHRRSSPAHRPRPPHTHAPARVHRPAQQGPPSGCSPSPWWPTTGRARSRTHEVRGGQGQPQGPSVSD